MADAGKRKPADVHVQLLVTLTKLDYSDSPWKNTGQAGKPKGSYYWYLFTGGNIGNGEGGFSFPQNSGPNTVDVIVTRLQAEGSLPATFGIFAFEVTGDAAGDLSSNASGDSNDPARILRITDSDAHIEGGTYGVFVVDSHAELTFRCDPPWGNVGVS